jgi:hypothetical protein
VRNIKGTFRDRKTASTAVRRLSEKSVPADEIEVLVMDAEGNLKRKVAIEDEAGTLRGAIIGAISGAVLGVVVIALVVAGVLGPTTTEPLGLTAVGGALRAALILAVAGVPLGAILGLGYWNGRTRISSREVRGGLIAVVVKSDDLAVTAREVLEEAGAGEVEISDGAHSTSTS